MTQEIIQRVATKAVIVRDGKVLLLREATTYEDGTNTGRYHFPGGRVEYGESYKDGLKREVLEETGLHITAIKEPVFVGEWSPVIKGVQNQIIAIFIVVEVEAGEIKLSEEHDDFKWVDLKNMGEIDIMPPDDEVIEAYYEQQK